MFDKAKLRDTKTHLSAFSYFFKTHGRRELAKLFRSLEDQPKKLDPTVQELLNLYKSDKSDFIKHLKK